MSEPLRIRQAWISKVPDIAPGIPSGQLRAEAEMEDGSEIILFSFYADELHFRPEEFRDLTEEEAQALFFKRDMDYLRAP